MRHARLFFRGTRALCPSSSLSRHQQRSLSSVGGRSTTSDSDSSSHSSTTTIKASKVGVAGVIASGLCLSWYLHGGGGGEKGEKGDVPSNHRLSLPSLLPQLRASEPEEKREGQEKVSIRERRYKAFSSIKYKGELYMTPRDFLESVTSDGPRRRLRCDKHYTVTIDYVKLTEIDPQFLNDKDVQKLLKSTIPRSKGSRRTFRDMWNVGMLNWDGLRKAVDV